MSPVKISGGSICRSIPSSPAASEFARRAFGDEVVDHYTHFFRTEQAAFNQTVTDWERRRYFERI
jgi:glutamine synthetase